jgi:phosphatidylglycerophosphatase A
MASLGPLGHLPASGSVTVVVVGVPLYYLMSSWPIGVRIAVALGFTLVSVWVHAVGDRMLNTKDSRTLVWDELAGFLFAVILLSEFTFVLAVLAVLIERVLDIVKVPPANWIERSLPGGWGVVGDDVVAGVYTSAVMTILVYWSPAWAGLAGR